MTGAGRLFKNRRFSAALSARQMSKAVRSKPSSLLAQDRPSWATVPQNLPVFRQPHGIDGTKAMLSGTTQGLGTTRKTSPTARPVLSRAPTLIADSAILFDSPLAKSRSRLRRSGIERRAGSQNWLVRFRGRLGDNAGGSGSTGNHGFPSGRSAAALQPRIAIWVSVQLPSGVRK